jgi:hypothetical protein
MKNLRNYFFTSCKLTALVLVLILLFITFIVNSHGRPNQADFCYIVKACDAINNSISHQEQYSIGGIAKEPMKIKLVDGFKVRNTEDIDFSVIGDNSVYPFIKPGEIWFDKSFIKEKDFFMELFKKRKILTEKYGYEKAKEMLRPKSKDLSGLRIKLIEEKGNTKIYLVDGAKVRQNLDPSFCFGGHWLVYNYVPKGEVWMDNATQEAEIKYIMVHELYELQLMSQGKDYNNAHDFANAAEKEARRKDGAKYKRD